LLLQHFDQIPRNDSKISSTNYRLMSCCKRVKVVCLPIIANINTVLLKQAINRDF